MMNFFQDIEYEDKYMILASISAKLEVKTVSFSIFDS